jgi:hypothetical protein
MIACRSTGAPSSGPRSGSGAPPPGLSGEAPTKTIKTYPTRIEAEIARTALDAAGIPCLIVGVDVSMEGGAAGVQLRVPEDQVELAIEILGES